MAFSVFIFGFLWDPPPKNCFGCVLYSIFIFNFQKKKSGFEYRKWIQLFNVFVFYEYEYSGIFINTVKAKNILSFSDAMCVSAKNYLKKKKYNDQIQV